MISEYPLKDFKVKLFLRIIIFIYYLFLYLSSYTIFVNYYSLVNKMQKLF